MAEHFGIPNPAELLRQVTAERKDVLVEDSFFERFMGFFHAIRWTEVRGVSSGCADTRVRDEPPTTFPILRPSRGSSASSRFTSSSGSLLLPCGATTRRRWLF